MVAHSDQIAVQTVGQVAAIEPVRPLPQVAREMLSQPSHDPPRPNGLFYPEWSPRPRKFHEPALRGEGDAILPAFRVGKSSLEDVGSVTEAEFAAVGIDRHPLNDHIAALEGFIKVVMPWILRGAISDRSS